MPKFDKTLKTKFGTCAEYMYNKKRDEKRDVDLTIFNHNK